jgi:hypothetical protein
MSDGFVWGMYSLIEHDVAIMIFAVLQLTTSALIVGLKLIHNQRAHKKILN